MPHGRRWRRCALRRRTPHACRRRSGPGGCRRPRRRLCAGRCRRRRSGRGGCRRRLSAGCCRRRRRPRGRRGLTRWRSGLPSGRPRRRTGANAVPTPARRSIILRRRRRPRGRRGRNWSARTARGRPSSGRGLTRWRSGLPSGRPRRRTGANAVPTPARRSIILRRWRRPRSRRGHDGRRARPHSGRRTARCRRTARRARCSRSRPPTSLRAPRRWAGRHGDRALRRWPTPSAAITEARPRGNGNADAGGDAGDDGKHRNRWQSASPDRRWRRRQVNEIGRSRLDQDDRRRRRERDKVNDLHRLVCQGRRHVGEFDRHEIRRRLEGRRKAMQATFAIGGVNPIRIALQIGPV